MGRLAALVDRIFPAESSAGANFFPGVDAEDTARTLNLVELATTRANGDQPPTESSSVDPVECKVIDHFANMLEQASQAYGQHLDAYARRMNEAIAVSAEIRSIARTAAADFKKSTTDNLNQIDNQMRLVSEISEDYRTFRQENRLRRTAVPRISPTLNAGILMIAIVVEGIVNGYFFAQGNALGLLGGITVALTVSVVNVGFSYLFGRLSRFVIHARFLAMLFGLLNLAAFLGWAGIFNLYVAHFRDAVGIMAWEQALSHSVTMFKANPISLANFESWILALIGALISIAVFAKAVFWDDVYPGFGPLSRRFEETVELYANFAGQAMSDLEALRDQRLEELDIVNSRITVGLRETAEILSARSSLGQEFINFQTALNRALNHTLGIYRDANREARSDTAPAYFNEPCMLDPIEPAARSSKSVEDIDALAESVSTDLTETMASIVTAYEEAIDRIPTARALREPS